jgi:hypothetical protein
MRRSVQLNAQAVWTAMESLIQYVPAWIPLPVCKQWQKEKSMPARRIEPLAYRLIDWAFSSVVYIWALGHGT